MDTLLCSGWNNEWFEAEPMFFIITVAANEQLERSLASLP